ncbi:uncharacterized protein LOC133187755 [Saccostrea echinata]|uniref:uncharacterized protein LOC133187755 n=1 Tax=Saccostrea echinata TaxID=191078 RepID=UPI002A83229A|nr:uncharacterized protein LOC133187755 [Saccostrea echinata]
MTDTQQLLRGVLVDPNDRDPDKQYDYVKEYVDFDGMFAEPAEMQSCDIIWACSKLMFTRGLQAYGNYRCFFCCISAFWGTAFAISSYCENFWYRPTKRFWELKKRTPTITKSFGYWVSCAITLLSACFDCSDGNEENTKKKRDSEIKTV